MFPELPKNLEALTDEELSAAHDEFKAVAAKAKKGDEETIGDLSPEELVETLQSGALTFKAIKAEQEKRAEAEANFDAALTELGAEFGVDDAKDEAATDDDSDEGDAEGDDADAEGTDAEAKDEEPEAVAASATKVRGPLPKARRRNRATAEQLDDGSGLRAGVESFALKVERGDRIDGKLLAGLFSEMVKKGRVQIGDKVVVASSTFQFPEERQLDRKVDSNAEKIEAVTGMPALVASGGLCAPLTPIYELPGVETAGRPVRDGALVGFQAVRGGVIVGANPTLVDYAEAVDTVTAADDETGGTFAVKNCMRIECPEFTEVEVNSVYRCIEAGNLTAKAYPELMSRIDTLVSANHARLGDGLLLDAIKAGSDAVTDVNTTTTAGALWKLIEFVHVAAAGMRSRHRMSDSERLRAIFPEWLLDMLVVDAARNGNDSDRFKTKGQLEEILGRAGINITYSKDGPSTGTGQVFGAQGAGNLLGFPSATQWALYPEGSWLHLDSGQLDLGIVRDSTLNSTNDFQIFAETWENAAYVGVESQWHTATLAPNGTNSAPKDYSGSTNF